MKGTAKNRIETTRQHVRLRAASYPGIQRSKLINLETGCARSDSKWHNSFGVDSITGGHPGWLVPRNLGLSAESLRDSFRAEMLGLVIWICAYRVSKPFLAQSEGIGALPAQQRCWDCQREFMEFRILRSSVSVCVALEGF